MNHLAQISTVPGYILAGGKSSRMGQDKGLMLFGQQTLAEFIIQKIKQALSSIIIVTNNDRYSKFGFEVIPDYYQNKGPAGGIYSALKHSSVRNDYIFIFSCDMPFITSDSILWFLNQSNSAQIILTQFQGVPQPLFGMYHTSCLDAWEILLQKNVLKLQNIISHFETSIIDIENNPLFFPTFFTNLNTPSDVTNALNNLTHGN
ncbi:MAG: molybdenum cofactor guanylyltransferase [Sphingobacteriales bacterium]|nr:MAG: molybdenum cofactor guanylyltransferase [Sphingobacteriales bacterium]